MKSHAAPTLTASNLPGRSFYRHSNVVSWIRFLPLVFLLVAVSGGLAVFMDFLFRMGHYYIFFAPAICAVPLLGLGFMAVAQGHCRNRWIAGFIGATAGLILYLGYYYVGMVRDLGPEEAHQIQLLPDYIRWRKLVEKTEDVNTPRRETEEASAPDKFDVVMNWFLFGSELLIVVAISVAGPLSRARKPYCERCHRWMKRHLTHLDPAEAQDLVDAIRNGSPTVLTRMFAAPEFTSIPNLTLAVDRCPDSPEGRPADCPAYLSAKLIAASPQGAHLDAFEHSKGLLLVRGILLETSELAAVTQRWSGSGTAPGYSATTQTARSPRTSSESHGSVEEADIQPVSEAFRGRILTKQTVLLGNAFIAVGLIALFASLGLGLWGAFLADPEKDSGRVATPAQKRVGTAMMVVGGLGFLGVAGLFLWEPTILANRWLEKRTRTAFQKRPILLVRPDDPDAVFVEVVPKLNWGRMSLETASDIGFLRLDRTRREILFEGDKECYRIPAMALTSCDVEVFVEGQGTAASSKVFFLVLRSQRAGALWEAPIRRRGDTGIFKGGKRRRWAESMHQGILEMRKR